MTLASMLFLANALQAPPPYTAWGNPDRGLRLGLAIEVRRDGPDIIRCFVKNEGDITIILSSKNFTMPPPMPVFTLKNRHVGAWQLTPPSAYPLVYDGPAWEIQVPAHMSTMVYSSRFWFPMQGGIYEIKADYAPMRRPLQAGKSVPVLSEMESGLTSLTIKPEDVHAAKAAGSG